MADRYIRIYEGIEPGTDVLGASASIGSVVWPEQDDFGLSPVQTYLETLGHTATILVGEPRADKELDKKYARLRYGTLPEESMSYSHLEITPPMSRQTVDELAGFILQNDLADPYHNSVHMYDQRPDHQRKVASW